MTLLRLTNSEMVEYRRCKRRWWLNSYRWLSKKVGEEAGTPSSIGTLCHDALAAYYDPTIKADPLEFISDTVNAEIALNPHDEKEILKEGELVTIMVQGYLEWLEETGMDSDLEILGAERMAEVPLVDGVTLLAKLDVPVRRERDNARLNMEHKTVQSLEDRLALAKLDSQYLTQHLIQFLHALGEGATTEEAYNQCQGTLLNMLRKVKRTARSNPPFYGREDVIHNVHELRNHWRHCLSVAQQIQETRSRLDAGEDHHTAVPPNPTHDCKWDCPFFAVCVMADDGSDFDGALDAMYVERDPLERYEGAQAL